MGSRARARRAQYAREAFQMDICEMQCFGREDYFGKVVLMIKPLAAKVMGRAVKARKMHKQVKVQRDTQLTMHWTGTLDQVRSEWRGNMYG